MLRFKNDDCIIESGSECNTLYLIEEGAALMTTASKSYRLGPGDVIGIADFINSTHDFSYTAKGNLSVNAICFDSTDELIRILDNNYSLCESIVSSLSRIVGMLLESYRADYEACKELCGYVHSVADFYSGACKDLGFIPKTPPFADEMMQTKVKYDISFWMSDYYKGVYDITKDSDSLNSGYVYGYVIKSCRDIYEIIDNTNKLKLKGEQLSQYLVGEDYLDYYELYEDLFFKSIQVGKNANFVTDIMNRIIETLKKNPFSDKALVVKRVVNTKARMLKTEQTVINHKDDATANSELMNSLNVILDYADTLDVTASEFKKAIESYKEQVDKISSDKAFTETRQALIKIYYVVYSEVMLRAILDDNVPTIIKMFLNFGYVDSTLCGYDNAIELYRICEKFKSSPERGIFTILQWMKAIYRGQREPSRNEYDSDYQSYVRSLIREGRISDSEAKSMAEDSKGKVVYELENMFPPVNKITFGRILSFCPVLLEENLCKDINSMLVDLERVEDVFNKLTRIDYSVFYHESVFEDLKLNVKENIYTDIRPDVILMPNAGSRGILWQEIEGSRRNTPGRMVVSILHQESLEKTFIRMFGEFRWEMCKREQGMRWNDVTARSLTAEYCDYVQFYSKNRDLSYETKEKIRESLKKYKNNFKEMFLNDYMFYMSYESNGSCRLNKYVRGILFKYCPMGEACRNVVKNNTIFHDHLHKHHITTSSKLHRNEQIQNKYIANGKEIPEVIRLQVELLAR